MENKRWLIDVNEWDTFFSEHIYSRCFRNEYEQGYTDALDRVDDWMEEHPTVDAVEVVHGRWEKNWHDNSLIGHEYEECSVCGCMISDTEKFWDCNYCPNCGAKMTEVSNE